jgi:hypothetical protein
MDPMLALVVTNILTSNPQLKTTNGELSKSANLNKVVIEFRKCKTMYKVHRKFQDEWACKLPWAKLVIDKDGKIHQVHYKLCTTIKGKKSF